MARKRMIDPQIWASEDFSKLSILARLVWIGLISNADDEGRGKANTAYLKAQIFPYDDELSLKKIDCALNEIQELMSIELYEVDQKKYYQLTKWDKFQTINRPTPSQIPKKNEHTMTTQTQFTEHSVSNHAQINDGSLPNINRREREEEIEIKREKKREEQVGNFLSSLSQKYPNVEINTKVVSPSYDLHKIYEAIEQSLFLQKSPLTFILQNYDKVITNYYKTIKRDEKISFMSRSYSEEELSSLFDNLDEVNL